MSIISSGYPSAVIVISHDRDLLDDFVDHILHLERGKLELYRPAPIPPSNACAREAQELAGKAGKKQEEQRKHLQAFVDRFRAKATKARQAQSRIKLLAKMPPISAPWSTTRAADKSAFAAKAAVAADHLAGERQRRLWRARRAVADRR